MSELGNKEIMAKNIKKYMDLKRIDRAKLSSDLNISYTTVSDWINGKTYPRIDKIEMLANYFGITKSQLVEDNNINKDILPIYNELNQNNQTKTYNFANELLKKQNSNIVDMRKWKDVYIQSKVSAGCGIVDLDQQHKELISYDGYVPPKYDLAFQVEGNSMEPMFRDGEVIFVEHQEEVRNGQLGVVTINDEAYIKKIYLEDDCLRLVSLNKEYDDIIANGEDTIKVVGRVIL